jgi:sensor histidine kinase YesM
MLDNAIEAAENAEKKEIYVDLYTVNNTYSAVKIENYTDKEPIILDGLLRTQKQNTDIHGIGIKSINNALKKYNSELTWTYDEENKFFRAIALIHIPQKAFRHE